ncbi:MAG: hypothetical protein LBP91_00375 [Coriobacteriales bacterium]|nr:hypothetical protein [Coriobacteriales bacterium]
MSGLKQKKKWLVLLVPLGLLLLWTGCSLAWEGTRNFEAPQDEIKSGVYGSWQNSSELLEEQLMRESQAASSGVSTGGREAIEISSSSRFRSSENGEPLVIYQFVNRVLVDNEKVTITLHAKTADELGDAGFTLMVENHYQPLTPAGIDNYCYITPVMGTWYVNGVKINPKTEGKVYPGKPGRIYLYFDELSTIDELTQVKGFFEVYYISDWWNPIGLFMLEEA